MKNIRLLTFVLIVGTLVLSACGAATATPTAAPDATKISKVDAMPVSFVGIVDRIAGNQWIISGTTVTVEASIVRDGPFKVGDQVKVEGFVNPDGSFTVSRVETPTPQETATLPPLSIDNSNEAISNANINDDSSSGVNSNDDNSNTSNSNDSNANDESGGNSNDDNSNSSNDNGDDNGGDRSNDNGDDSGGGNSNDDQGNDDNSDKAGGDDNGGDDNGGNSNDD